MRSTLVLLVLAYVLSAGFATLLLGAFGGIVASVVFAFFAVLLFFKIP